MILYKKQIIKIFTDLEKLKEDGIWYDGIKKEGKYKKWYKNGQLKIDANYKNGKKW